MYFHVPVSVIVPARLCVGGRTWNDAAARAASWAPWALTGRQPASTDVVPASRHWARAWYGPSLLSEIAAVVVVEEEVVVVAVVVTLVVVVVVVVVAVVAEVVATAVVVEASWLTVCACFGCVCVCVYVCACTRVCVCVRERERKSYIPQKGSKENKS